MEDVLMPLAFESDEGKKAVERWNEIQNSPLMKAISE
jgi:hypothetical protein